VRSSACRPEPVLAMGRNSRKHGGKGKVHKRTEKRLAFYGRATGSFVTGQSARRHDLREERKEWLIQGRWGSPGEKEYVLDDDDCSGDDESSEEEWGGSAEARAAFWAKYDTEQKMTLQQFAEEYDVEGVKNSHRKRKREDEKVEEEREKPENRAEDDPAELVGDRASEQEGSASHESSEGLPPTCHHEEDLPTTINSDEEDLPMTINSDEETPWEPPTSESEEEVHEVDSDEESDGYGYGGDFALIPEENGPGETTQDAAALERERIAEELIREEEAERGLFGVSNAPKLSKKARKRAAREQKASAVIYTDDDLSSEELDQSPDIDSALGAPPRHEVDEESEDDARHGGMVQKPGRAAKDKKGRGKGGKGQNGKHKRETAGKGRGKKEKMHGKPTSNSKSAQKKRMKQYGSRGPNTYVVFS